jgi:hypothetical protein
VAGVFVGCVYLAKEVEYYEGTDLIGWLMDFSGVSTERVVSVVDRAYASGRYSNVPIIALVFEWKRLSKEFPDGNS